MNAQQLQPIVDQMISAASALQLLIDNAGTPERLPKDWRDKSLVLGDQCKNPGSMNYGKRAKRYGAVQFYEGTPGNKTAVFPTWEQGTAALIDRILRDEGETVEDYITDGVTSYSGGQDYGGYLEAMSNYVGAGEIIRDDAEFLWVMVAAHAKAEGNERPIDFDFFNGGYALYRATQTLAAQQ